MYTKDKHSAGADKQVTNRRIRQILLQLDYSLVLCLFILEIEFRRYYCSKCNFFRFAIFNLLLFKTNKLFMPNLILTYRACYY